MATNGFREDLLDHYPQPLAATYARFIDQPDPTAQHQLLLALFEATLKYLAVATTGQYLARGLRDPVVDAALARLAHPSLGHWAALLRAALAPPPPALAAAACVFPELPALYNQSAPALARGAALLRQVRQTGDTRISLRQLFDGLVEYRNSQAHGAGGGAAHFAALVPLLQEAIEEALLALPSLRACELLFVDSVSIVRGGERTVAQLRLMSDRPRLRLLRQTLGAADGYPEPQQLYLMPGSRLADAVPLHPLGVFLPACVVCSEAQVGLLNGTTARAVEYLCYGCGHTNQAPALLDELAALLAAAGPAPGPPPATPRPRPAAATLAPRAPQHNLPAEQTAFIGRERETEALQALLRRSAVRLVTLVGPAGTGKTRLALHAAHQLLADFPDGVWFVDLSPLTDPALVPAALAAVLGVREEGATPLLARLQRELADKRVLILLDNFEQVAAAATTVSSLLKATSRVKLLATSRLPLHIYGEREVPVPPLTLPRRDRLPPLEDLTQYEAVRLFIERAQDVRPDFQVTTDNAPAVAEICTRLDGLPLAIELAAARVKLLSPQALLVRLDQRLTLLTGGAPTLPARQQTLRGALEWSYDLLDGDEQVLFRRLAVFQGGRTFEAMEAICNAEGDLAVAVFDGVGSLVNKSLVQQRAGRGGEIRFWMLETIHEYAGEKLRESGESAVLARRHAEYFLALAEAAEPHLRSAQQAEWLARLEDEHENLRAVLAWALHEAPGEEQARLLLGLRLIGALEGFWRVRGHFSEGRSWVAAALEREAKTVGTAPVAGVAAVNEELARAKAGALYTGGRLAWQQGDEAAARGPLEESLAISRRLGDKRRSARALNDLGIVAANQGATPTARAMWEESLVLWRELRDTRGAGLALGNLGYLALTEGDAAPARLLLEEALGLIRELGEKSLVAIGLGNLGIAALQQADYVGARAFQNEALALCVELGDKHSVAHSLVVLAAVAMRNAGRPQARGANAAGGGAEQQGTGDLARVARLLGAADALLESIGGALDPIEHRIYEQVTTAARTLLGEQEFAVAYRVGQALTLEQAVAAAVSG